MAGTKNSGPKSSLHENPVFASMGLSDTIETRFWSKVKKTDNCWIWTGAKSGRYGHVGAGDRNSKRIKVHIISWIFANNRIPPKGFEVCHNCPGGDNTLCVNPKHLWIGTHLDNMRDMKAKKTFRKETK